MNVVPGEKQELDCLMANIYLIWFIKSVDVIPFYLIVFSLLLMH